MKQLLAVTATLAWLLAGPVAADHHEHKPGDGHDHGHDHGTAAAPKPDGKTDGKKKNGAKSGSVTGTVVDLACQILGEKPDAGHKGCAEGGVPVGLVDAKGRLWTAIDANYGSATDELLPFMGQKVKASGWIVERKNERLISIATVEPVTAPVKADGKTNAKATWVCPHACSTADKPGKCHCGLEMVKKAD